MNAPRLRDVWKDQVTFRFFCHQQPIAGRVLVMTVENRCRKPQKIGSLLYGIRASQDSHLKEQAFRLWAATLRDGDLDILKRVDPAEKLWDRALFARLVRGDHTAVPFLEEKLRHQGSALLVADWAIYLVGSG